MILLEDSHKMVRELLLPKIGAKGGAGPLAVTLADFDDITLAVHADSESPIVFVSIKFKYGLAELTEHGAESHLKKVFGDGNVVAAKEGFDFTVKGDMSTATEKTVEDLASLKRHVMSAPFYSCFEKAAKGETSDAYVIPIRQGEYIYLKPVKPSGGGELNVAITFRIAFQERTDLAMAEVFMKEFSEARRDPQLSQSPSVTYTKDVPSDFTGVPGCKSDKNSGFVRFTLFKRHYTDKKDSVISNIHSFRNYLLYHIKCSKAYMHMRMRKRVANWLQILNRAKPDKEAGEKKTASGRTFVRK